MKLAVIETGGKQYAVVPGTKIKIEKLVRNGIADACSFDKVLLRADGDAVEIGRPYVSGAAVQGKILGEGRHEKKIVFKYHSKNRSRKKKGHRQGFTEVEIRSI
ncbi:MAG: 50S ribosomal protein L21 [Candidatus Liptonbacteria bacterium]|nr:50S ribosomal protein L21 [Candidatus Liptonbacteria bacterium]